MKTYCKELRICVKRDQNVIKRYYDAIKTCLCKTYLNIFDKSSQNDVSQKEPGMMKFHNL